MSLALARLGTLHARHSSPSSETLFLYHISEPTPLLKNLTADLTLVPLSLSTPAQQVFIHIPHNQNGKKSDHGPHVRVQFWTTFTLLLHINIIVHEKIIVHPISFFSLFQLACTSRLLGMGEFLLVFYFSCCIFQTSNEHSCDTTHAIVHYDVPSHFTLNSQLQQHAPASGWCSCHSRGAFASYVTLQTFWKR